MNAVILAMLLNNSMLIYQDVDYTRQLSEIMQTPYELNPFARPWVDRGNYAGLLFTALILNAGAEMFLSLWPPLAALYGAGVGLIEYLICARYTSLLNSPLSIQVTLFAVLF